jgi:putative tricarboxylic transport membrane protein
MPADISDDAKQYWVDAMDTIYASDEWQSVMTQNGLMPFHMSAGEFETFVTDQIADIEQLSKDIGLIQ